MRRHEGERCRALCRTRWPIRSLLRWQWRWLGCLGNSTTSPLQLRPHQREWHPVQATSHSFRREALCEPRHLRTWYPLRTPGRPGPESGRYPPDPGMRKQRGRCLLWRRSTAELQYPGQVSHQSGCHTIGQTPDASQVARPSPDNGGWERAGTRSKACR